LTVSPTNAATANDPYGPCSLTCVEKGGDIDAKGNLVGMTNEHAKANADLWEFSLQEMPQQTA
jgi:hypothetical protein